MSLNINHIGKTYKHGMINTRFTQALIDVSFFAPNGSILAVIGQNGAGKTTLIKCILNLLHPDIGDINFDDKTIDDIIREGNLGYMPENLHFPDMITFKEYITDIMILRGKNINVYKERFDRLVDKLFLTDHINKNMSEYSKGTMKKVAFIQAVLHQPKLLVLDEPTDGLDPVSRRVLLNELIEIKQAGGIVLITTHILSDLELIADKVVVLQKGTIIKEEILSKIETSLDDWYLNTLIENGGMNL